MSRLVRTFSGNDVLNSPSTSPIVTTVGLKGSLALPPGRASSPPKGLMPLGLTRSQNELFNLMCDVSACAPAEEDTWVGGAGCASGQPGDASGDSTASGSVPGFASDVYPANGNNVIDEISTMPLFDSLSAAQYGINSASPASSSVSSNNWPSSSPATSEIRDEDSFPTGPPALLLSGPEQHAQWPLFAAPVALIAPPQYTLPEPSVPQPVHPVLPVVNPLEVVPQELPPPVNMKHNDGVGPVRRSGRKAAAVAPYPQAQDQDLYEDVESDTELESYGRGRSSKPYACEICGTRFCRDFERVRHLKSHQDQNLTCGICHKVIKNGRKDALRRHQLRTRKCVAKQAGMPDEELAALGCVTSGDRALWQARITKGSDESEE